MSTSTPSPDSVSWERVWLPQCARAGKTLLEGGADGMQHPKVSPATPPHVHPLADGRTTPSTWYSQTLTLPAGKRDLYVQFSYHKARPGKMNFNQRGNILITRTASFDNGNVILCNASNFCLCHPCRSRHSMSNPPNDSFFI